jgi:hypothetical protein
MPQLKMNKDKKLTLVGKKHTFTDLSVVQMQNVMLKLDYEKECLFDCLVNMEDFGDNICEIGMCGGYMFSYRQEVV